MNLFDLKILNKEEGKMKKSIYLGILVLLIGSLILPGSVFAAGKKLRVQADAWIIKKFPLYEAAKKFEKDHPNVNVTVFKKDPQASTQGYLMWWKSGRCNVDLAVGVEAARLSPLVEANLLVPWDDFFTGDFTRDQFIPALVDVGIFHGKQYVLPFMGEVMFISVNKEMFKNAGLVGLNGDIIPAKTFGELRDYARKLTNESKGIRGLDLNWGWNFLMQTYLSGLQALRGNIYEADNNTIAFDSPESLQFLTFAQSIVRDGWGGKGSIADNNVPRNDFKAGKVAMIWTAHSRFMEGANVLGKDKVTVMSIPRSDKNGTLAYGHCVYIPKLSPVPNLAKQFVKEQMMAHWFKAWTWKRYAKLPVLKRNYEGLAYPKIISRILKAAKRATYCPKYRDYNRLDKLCQREIQNMIMGKQSPQETINNIISGEKGLILVRLSK